MTRLPFILPICIISLLSGCQDANPAEREWKDQLYKNLAIVGARNWIVCGILLSRLHGNRHQNHGFRQDIG